MRIKICRKEAKETSYWLRLLDTSDGKELETTRQALVNEGRELTKILVQYWKSQNNFKMQTAVVEFWIYFLEI